MQGGGQKKAPTSTQAIPVLSGVCGGRLTMLMYKITFSIFCKRAYKTFRFFFSAACNWHVPYPIDAECHEGQAYRKAKERRVAFLASPCTTDI